LTLPSLINIRHGTVREEEKASVQGVRQRSKSNTTWNTAEQVETGDKIQVALWYLSWTSRVHATRTLIEKGNEEIDYGRSNLRQSFGRWESYEDIQLGDMNKFVVNKRLGRYTSNW